MGSIVFCEFILIGIVPIEHDNGSTLNSNTCLLQYDRSSSSWSSRTLLSLVAWEDWIGITSIGNFVLWDCSNEAGWFSSDSVGNTSGRGWDGDNCFKGDELSMAISFVLPLSLSLLLLVVVVVRVDVFKFWEISEIGLNWHGVSWTCSVKNGYFSTFCFCAHAW